MENNRVGGLFHQVGGHFASVVNSSVMEGPLKGFNFYYFPTITRHTHRSHVTFLTDPFRLSAHPIAIFCWPIHSSCRLISVRLVRVRRLPSMCEDDLLHSGRDMFQLGFPHCRIEG